jgi:phosphoribosyl-ATP pyrophosphohydrolase
MSKACSVLVRLESIVRSRIRERPPDSYTAMLARKGVSYIARKVGEEAIELAIEAVQGNRHGIVREAADLLYHLIVLLNVAGLGLSSVANELEARMNGRYSRG